MLSEASGEHPSSVALNDNHGFPDGNVLFSANISTVTFLDGDCSSLLAQILGKPGNNSIDNVMPLKWH